jgi:glycosyltransferase involved in cell wall biosynthesis
MHAGVLARRRIRAAGIRRFDVLHFHRQATAYASLDLMRRIPSIVSLDCTQSCVADRATSSVERASYLPNAWMDGAVFRRAFAVISISAWAAGALRREYPDIQTPVHVMPNPVLLSHFDGAWIEERRARAASGMPPRFVFMGGDFPRKGGYDLLEAWEAGRMHERAHLEVVTNWQIGRSLPAGATLTRNVAPYSPEWRALWKRADAFVMPTRNEAFGLVYQEAAAAGIPAIGTALNAVPEVVREGETGLLVPVGDRPALAAAMATLAASPALRDRLGTRGRAVIEDVASPTQYLERLTALIVEAARQRPKRMSQEKPA